MSSISNNVGYFNSDPTLVRGTDGSVGTTSFPYGQPFAAVSAVNYRSMLRNINCPVNMGVVQGSCECVMNTWVPAFAPVYSMNTSIYTLDQTYYQPLPSSVVNVAAAAGADDIDSLDP